MLKVVPPNVDALSRRPKCPPGGGFGESVCAGVVAPVDAVVVETVMEECGSGDDAVVGSSRTMVSYEIKVTPKARYVVTIRAYQSQGEFCAGFDRGLNAYEGKWVRSYRPNWKI